jgi:hypothetical protein
MGAERNIKVGAQVLVALCLQSELRLLDEPLGLAFESQVPSGRGHVLSPLKDC